MQSTRPRAKLGDYPLESSARQSRPSNPVQAAPQTANVILEHHYGRWSTFRSGRVDISFPLSSAGPSTDPAYPRIDQPPLQTAVQSENFALVETTHTDPHAGICANDVGLEDRDLQCDVLGTTHSACSEDAEPPSECGPVTRAFTSVCGNLFLSLGSHDRPRRILRDHNAAYVVTAHGNIDQVGMTNTMKLDRNIRSPLLPFEELVDDACILSRQGDPLITLGHAREQDQITLLIPGHGQVPRHVALHRDWNTTKRFGASATTSLMSPLKIASGGYDHRVHLWDIAQDLSGASSVALAVTHTSAIHSLLPVFDTSHKLVSVGADRDVHVYDMSAERVVQTLKMSCMPFHAHNTDSPSCTLIEVSHLETQFEVRDYRLPTRAVQRFGFFQRKGEDVTKKVCPQVLQDSCVCGDKNGTIHLWD